MTGAGVIYDVAIVGGGPAGLSAAILLARSLRSTILFDNGQPRNLPAREIHGYLGFEGIAPLNLRKRGREQASKYGVQFYDHEVVKIQNATENQRSRFTLETVGGHTATARKVLLATGIRDDLPELENIRAFYGQSVHHCPYCDAWEHRGKRIVALGDHDNPIGSALMLHQWSAQIVACSNGLDVSSDTSKILAKNRIDLCTKSIVRLEGAAGQLEQIVFEDGTSLGCDALFFKSPQRQQSPLAVQLGCRPKEESAVQTTSRQGTGVRGLFVAGDADGGVQFAIVAAAEGATAATAINRELQDEDQIE
jgi:thioredoxin reductase